MAPIENCLGAATALIRRTTLLSLGGYTEDYGVGHEDFEFYVRALQAGFRLEVCPIPLYLYEVDRPSMALSTRRLKNASRVLRSINPSSRAEDWRDMLSLVSGTRAQEHAINYVGYLHKISPHSELLQRVAHVSLGSDPHIKLVGEYADAVGARSFALAMDQLAAGSAAGRGARDPIAEPIMPRSDKAHTLDSGSACIIDSHVLAGLVDISFGRVAAAAEALRLSVERSAGRIKQDHVRVLKALCQTSNLDRADLQSIVNIARQARIAPEEFRDAAPALFHIALLAGDSGLALSVLDRVFRLDEEAYLNANPDVVEAIATGGVSAAFDHFSHYGTKENRTGFLMMSALGDALHAALKIELPLGALRQFVVDLGKAEPVPAPPVSHGKITEGGKRNRSRQVVEPNLKLVETA